MGHCNNPKQIKKDVCDGCYYRFHGELGMHMSEVVRLMIKRAIERNKFEVKVTKNDIYEVWPSDNSCVIMDTPFTIGGDLDTSPSLDRINPIRGYVSGNIQIISNLANRMKNNADDEQLLRFSHYYIEYYRKWYVEGKVGKDIRASN
jgi:hypothetical protein